MLAALALLQLATFLGSRGDQDEAQAAVVGITDYCLPVATGGASGKAAAIAGTRDLPSRLRYPMGALIPAHWGEYRAMALPASNGQVWVVAFEDGRCLVRAWGNVLGPVSQAVHALFDQAPWQQSNAGWTATFQPAAPGKVAARGVTARYTSEQVDNVDVQGDAVILLTPATPLVDDNGFTFRTRHP